MRQTRLAPGSGVAGQVLDVSGRLIVAAGEGALEILVGQLPNRKPVSGRDLVNGAHIAVGERFG